jgi:hypothetical protein
MGAAWVVVTARLASASSVPAAHHSAKAGVAPLVVAARAATRAATHGRRLGCGHGQAGQRKRRAGGKPLQSVELQSHHMSFNGVQHEQDAAPRAYLPHAAPVKWCDPVAQNGPEGHAPPNGTGTRPMLAHSVKNCR